MDKDKELERKEYDRDVVSGMGIAVLSVAFGVIVVTLGIISIIGCITK